MDEHVDRQIGGVAERGVQTVAALVDDNLARQLKEAVYAQKGARAQRCLEEPLPEFFGRQNGGRDDEVRQQVHERHQALHALKVAPEASRDILAGEVRKRHDADKSGDRDQDPRSPGAIRGVQERQDGPPAEQYLNDDAKDEILPDDERKEHGVRHDERNKGYQKNTPYHAVPQYFLWIHFFFFLNRLNSSIDSPALLIWAASSPGASSLWFGMTNGG